MRDLFINMKKEWMEALRTKKVIGIVALALFFSIADPIMLKLTPFLFEEFSGVDLGSIIQLTQIAEMKEFHGDMYQLFGIVLIILISNIWVSEVKNETMVIPVSKGVSKSSIILAKSLTYGLLVMVLMVLSYMVNYYYAGLIFGYRMEAYQALTSGLLMGLYYCFMVFFIVAISAFVTHFAGVVFIALITTFAGPILTGLFEVSHFSPFGLLEEAGLFPRVLGGHVLTSVLTTLLVMVLAYSIGSYGAMKKEIIKYR